MELTDRQYERIARYLDGEAVELDPAELAEAANISAQERQVGALLDVRVPPAALAKARRSLAAAAPVRRNLVLRLTYYGAVVAAAAAVVLAVTSLPYSSPTASASVREVPTAVLFGDSETAEDASQLAAIAQQISKLQEQLMVSVPAQPNEAFQLEPYPTSAASQPSTARTGGEPSG